MVPMISLVLYRSSITNEKLNLTTLSGWGWNSQHNVGMLETTSGLLNSLRTLYTRTVYGVEDTLDAIFDGISQGNVLIALEDLGSSISSINNITTESVDIVFLTYSLMSNTQVVESVTTEVSNSTVFMCAVPYYPDSNVRDIPNLVLYWADLYQATYLSGVVAGSVLEPGGKLCYIKPFNDTECNVAMNSFAQGVMKANPTAIIHYWISNTYYDVYSLTQLAQHLLNDHDCDQLGFYGAVLEALFVFTAAGKYVSAATADVRMALGDGVLSSALYDWTPVYSRIVRAKLNNAVDILAPDRVVTYGIDAGATYLSDISASVPIEKLELLHEVWHNLQIVLREMSIN